MARGWPGVLQLPPSRDTAYNPPPSQHTDADGWAWSISVGRVGSRGLQFTTEGLQVWSRTRVGSQGLIKSHSCAAVGLGSSGLPIDRSSPSGQSPSETEFLSVPSGSR